MWYLASPSLVRLWQNRFVWGPASLRTECTGVFQNGYFSSPPFKKHRGIFLWCSGSVRASEGKTHNRVGVWGPPSDWAPLAFLPLRFVRTEPPALCQLQFRFSYPSTGSWRFMLLDFSFLKLKLSAFACLSNVGAAASLATSLHQWIQKELLISQLTSFLLVKMEWRSPSFLHAMLEETGTSGSNHFW